MAVLDTDRVRTRSRAPAPRRPAARVPHRRDRIGGLDGVRALAVLAVLVFHLRPASLRGGYLGVDVFFVLSGFLITTLLVREVADDGRIDLRGFWTRRARRLLPALVLVVTTSTALALLAGNDLLVGIRRQVLGALTFSHNWWEVAAGADYFGATAPRLFVNVWSLAVEEQFYLLWPVLLAVLLAAVTTTRRRVVVVASLALASAVAMAVLVGGEGISRVYYGTDTRVFGLMIGAALALGLHPRLTRHRGRGAPRVGPWTVLRLPVAVLSLTSLVLLMLLLDGESLLAYRGGIVAACLLTAALLAAVATAPAGDPLVRLLSLRPLVWVGERSYGIYLWHWPVILLLAAVLPATTPDSAGSWAVRGLAVATTFTVSAASYRLLEQPVRRHGFRGAARRALAALAWAPRRVTRPRVAAALAGAVAVLFVVALVTAPERSRVEMQMEAASGAVAGERAGAEAEPPPTVDPASLVPDADENGAVGTGADVSAFGDSMLYVAAPALRTRLPEIAIDAESNRQWSDVVEEIRTALDQGAVRDVVVVAAGTNAGVTDVTDVTELLDLLGPDRRVVLVNLAHASAWIPESNATLAAGAEGRPRVAVADWNGAIARYPDQLQPDGVHPDMDGMYLYADTVTAALAGLGALG